MAVELGELKITLETVFDPAAPGALGWTITGTTRSGAEVLFSQPLPPSVVSTISATIDAAVESAGGPASMLAPHVQRATTQLRAIVQTEISRYQLLADNLAALEAAQAALQQ